MKFYRRRCKVREHIARIYAMRRAERMGLSFIEALGLVALDAEVRNG